METDTAYEPVNEMWDPGELGGYFLTDELNALPQVADATGTDVSVVAKSDPIRICITGQNKEDVDEALDKLQIALGFIVRSTLLPSRL